MYQREETPWFKDSASWNRCSSCADVFVLEGKNLAKIDKNRSISKRQGIEWGGLEEPRTNISYSFNVLKSLFINYLLLLYIYYDGELTDVCRSKRDNAADFLLPSCEFCG